MKHKKVVKKHFFIKKAKTIRKTVENLPKNTIFIQKCILSDLEYKSKTSHHLNLLKFIYKILVKKLFPT